MTTSINQTIQIDTAPDSVTLTPTRWYRAP
jgi:hypothetical protein